ncbi:MAG: hypothetical protein ABIQ18_13710 [Umezawaea sp.]
MGWQEELSALDEALAAGRITPDQHRSRRDELLAAASGGGPTPMRWQASQPSDPEQTGIIRTSQFTDSEKTQQVRPVGFPPPTPDQEFSQQQFGQAPPPPWGDQGFGVSPNKTGMHGPEVFGSGAGKSPRVGIYVLIGVLAFVVIGGGVFWFGLSGGMGTESAALPITTTTTTTTPAESSAPSPSVAPSGLAAVPNPPGSLNPKNGEYTLEGAKNAKILSEIDVPALEAAGVDQIFDKSSGEGNLTFAIAVYVAKDEQSAKELSAALVQNRAARGTSTVDIADVPKSVTTTQYPSSTQFLYRGIYTSGKMTVRIATAGPSTVPDQDVAAKFTDYLRKVLGSIRAE